MRRTAPFVVVSVVGVLLGLLVVTASSASDVDDVADDGGMLGSEQYLKQMIAYVTPLMAILRKDQLRVKRETTDPIERDSYGYGGGGGGYESSYEPCCDDKQDYVAILSLVALGLLFLFLITLLSTSTTGGRKKRSNNDNDDDEDLADFIQDLAKHQDPRNAIFYFYFFSFCVGIRLRNNLIWCGHQAVVRSRCHFDCLETAHQELTNVSRVDSRRSRRRSRSKMLKLCRFAFNSLTEGVVSIVHFVKWFECANNSPRSFDSFRVFASFLFMGRLGCCLLLSVFAVFRLVVLVTNADDAVDDKENVLESEKELKRMLTFVTPLMAIVHRKDERVKRQFNNDQIDRNSYGHNGGYYQLKLYSKDKADYVAILSLVSLGLLFLFLITLLSTTTFSSGRKKRSEHQDNFIQDFSRHDISKH